MTDFAVAWIPMACVVLVIAKAFLEARREHAAVERDVQAKLMLTGIGGIAAASATVPTFLMVDGDVHGVMGVQKLLTVTAKTKTSKPTFVSCAPARYCLSCRRTFVTDGSSESYAHTCQEVSILRPAEKSHSLKARQSGWNNLETKQYLDDLMRLP